jgi:hypothetical protein
MHVGAFQEGSPFGNLSVHLGSYLFYRNLRCGDLLYRLLLLLLTRIRRGYHYHSHGGSLLVVLHVMC